MSCVGCVYSRMGKSDKEMLCERLLVEVCYSENVNQVRGGFKLILNGFNVVFVIYN